MNFAHAIGIIPIAEPKFINPSASNPPSPRPSPPLTRGERAGSGGILHAQQFVNFDGAIGISAQELADRLRVKAVTVRYHLRRLHEVELVEPTTSPP